MLLHQEQGLLQRIGSLNVTNGEMNLDLCLQQQRLRAAEQAFVATRDAKTAVVGGKRGAVLAFSLERFAEFGRLLGKQRRIIVTACFDSGNQSADAGGVGHRYKRGEGCRFTR